MQLLTIKDLLEGDPAEVDSMVARASGISETYENYFAEDEGDSHTRAPGLHASEISGCERKAVYSLMATPRIEQSAPVWRRRFKIGHAIHKMFQDDLERMAGKKRYFIDFVPEVRVHPCMEQPLAAKWDIHSHTDGIFTVRESEDGPPLYRVILEIKSEAPASYEKLQAIKDEHVEQAHVYMACLDVPLTWFLYYNKGNQNFTPSTNPNFFLRFNPKTWEKLEERFERMHVAALNNTLPDRKEGLPCEFCAFSHVCKPNYTLRQGGHAPKPSHWGK